MAAYTDPAVILVADDDPFIRHMLTRYLQHEGYQVIEAPHGEAASICTFTTSPTWCCSMP